MTIWCKLLVCAFVIFCTVNGEEVTDIAADFGRIRLNVNDVISGNILEGTNEKKIVNFEENFAENHQFDDANKGNTRTQLGWKRTNSPSYNRAHSGYLETFNIPATEQKSSPKKEEDYIQVPNKGGRLEQIKREKLSPNANERVAVQFNNQGKSYDSGHRRHVYEFNIDPNSGHHIISERQKYQNDDSNKEQDELVMTNKKSSFDDYTSQLDDIKNKKMNTESNQARQTLPIIDTDTEEVQYAAQEKSLSHDSIYLANANPKKHMEPVGVSSDLKEKVNNNASDYGGRTTSDSAESTCVAGAKIDQMFLPRPTKLKESKAYQHEPRPNFDSKLVNFESENKDTRDLGNVEGEYEESSNWEDKKEYKIGEDGNKMEDKFSNVDAGFAARQETSQGYRTKQHISKEGFESSEVEERATFHPVAQLLQKQNSKYSNQQLPHNSLEDGAQQQIHGYEQTNVLPGSSYNQTNAKAEEARSITNFDTVLPRVHNHNSNNLERNSSNQDVHEETQNQPYIGTGNNEQGYEYDQQLLSNHQVNKDHPQLSHFIHKANFEVLKDTNVQYGSTQMGKKHLEDYNLPSFHDSRSTDYSQQHDLYKTNPTFKLEKENVYYSDTNKKSIPKMMLSLKGPPNMLSINNVRNTQ